jgi:hypothetical protein
MSESNETSGAVWAVVTLLIFLVVVAALYFGGAFSKGTAVDLNIRSPAWRQHSKMIEC